MKRAIVLLLGIGGLLLLPISPSFADTLDDYLRPQCGWSDDPRTAAEDPDAWANTVIARFGPEIVARAQNHAALAPTPENKQLMWLLGAMPDCEARELSAQIVGTGDPAFRARVMGGIGRAPDAAGVEVLLSGAADTDPAIRETAIVVLTERIIFREAALLSADEAAALDQFAARLEALAATEPEPRLRGLLLARIHALTGESGQGGVTR